MTQNGVSQSGEGGKNAGVVGGWLVDGWMDGLRLEPEAHSLFQSLFPFVLLSFHSTEWKRCSGREKANHFPGSHRVLFTHTDGQVCRTVQYVCVKCGLVLASYLQ